MTETKRRENMQKARDNWTGKFKKAAEQSGKSITHGEAQKRAGEHVERVSRDIGLG